MLILNSRKVSFVVSISLFDVAFLSSFWNLSKGLFRVHKSFLGNTEQWIMVLVNPESKKILSIFWIGGSQLSYMRKQCIIVNFSVFDTCCTGAWRWWHSFILVPHQCWSHWFGKYCSKGSWTGVLLQVLLGSQVSVKNPLNHVLRAPVGNFGS